MQLEEECNDEKSLKDMFNSEEFNFHMKLDEKEDVLSGLCCHFTIYKSIAELDQLVEGLQTLRFNCLMKNYPSQLKQIFKAPLHDSRVVLTLYKICLRLCIIQM